MKKPNHKKGLTDFRKTGPALTLGTNMAVGIAVFTFIGYQVDKKLGTDDIWTLCGVFLGLIYCGYEVWKVIRQIQRDEQQEANHLDHHHDGNGKDPS